ncbi:flocculation protein FLO11 isoform X2 [Teleopsis dalmanni]|uniref:flocculation protein FLO11 isoform X2 n=1 Tax=Teleopsis dalmanni TaxID=139649 RepID=UPI0018CC9521|nr:flocculation protein FLO11 isoform X2 [Teleopsis dalmanni]
MQTVVDYHGSNNSIGNSNNNSNGSSTTTTTTTTTIETIGTHSEVDSGKIDATNAVALTTPPIVAAEDNEEPNILRQRITAAKSTTIATAITTTNATITTTTTTNCSLPDMFTHKNGNACMIDVAEYLGSNIIKMSATPSPSPEGSPKVSLTKKCLTTHMIPTLTPVTATTTTIPATATATAAVRATAIVTQAIETNTIITDTNNINNSPTSSNSNSNSNSNSSTSSVIATPVLTHNGKETDCGVGLNNIRRSTERNEILATKVLPLSSKSNTFDAYDKAGHDLTAISTNKEFFTPISPSPLSSTNSAATPSSPASSTTTSVSSSSSVNSSTVAVSSATINSKVNKTIDEELLHWNDMPQYLQFNPYVLKGYRPLQTFKGCLFSLFYWHNETINILTHAIPIVYILAIVPGLMPWEKGYRFLSFCHVFGSVAPWCGSFVYHLFMNIEKGENVYYRLLKLDMVGIWVSQSFGALPLVTAATYCFSYKWKWLIITSYCLLSLWGLYKALTASSPWQRRLCFAMPFTMRSILTVLRTLGLVGGNRVALSHVYLQDGVSILGGAIGAMRIPEKWFPGLVDFYLNSHNIMHVLVVVAVYSMHKATLRDFEWMSTTSCDSFTNTTVSAISNAMGTNLEL